MCSVCREREAALTTPPTPMRMARRRLWCTPLLASPWPVPAVTSRPPLSLGVCPGEKRLGAHTGLEREGAARPGPVEDAAKGQGVPGLGSEDFSGDQDHPSWGLRAQPATPLCACECVCYPGGPGRPVGVRGRPGPGQRLCKLRFPPLGPREGKASFTFPVSHVRRVFEQPFLKPDPGQSGSARCGGVSPLGVP